MDQEIEMVARDFARRGIATGWYWQVGETIHVRTVTYHAIGTVAEVTADYIVLQPSAWIADATRSARLTDLLQRGVGESSEVEPIPDGDPHVIQRAAIVDSFRYHGPVPTRQQP